MKTKHKVLAVNVENAGKGSLYSLLEESYELSICDDIPEELDAAVKSYSPELIIYNMTEYYEDKASAMLEQLSTMYTEIKIIVISLEEHYKSNLQYFVSDQFINVILPASADSIAAECRAVFGEDKIPKKAPDNSVKSGSILHKKPHIMIIDDNAILLRTVKDMLNDKFTVSIAVSSSQAFMAMSRNMPDIILLDYEMPIVNGEATLKMIRENDDMKDIPVIFFTSSADLEVVKKLIALGPDGYILKPPNKQTMVSQIEKTLRDRYSGKL